MSSQLHNDIYDDPQLIDRDVQPDDLDSYYAEVASYEYSDEIGEGPPSFPYPVKDKLWQ